MLSTGKLSIVDWPKIIFEMKSETIAETIAMKTSVLSNPWLISSKTNITPANGALKAAVIPTAEPTSISLSSSVFEPLKSLAIP